LADTDPTLEGADNQQPERPDWLPENFKDPEALVGSYKELQRTLTSKSTRERDLEQQVSQYEEMLAQAQTTQQPQTNNDALYEAYERDPVATMAWLAQQAAQQAVATTQQEQTKTSQPILEQQNQLLAYAADQLVSQKLADWNDYKESVATEIAQNPDLLPESALTSPERAANALERVYKMVKYDGLASETQSLSERLAAEQLLAKQQAQTLSGVPGRPVATDDDKDYWKSIESVKTNRFGS
jgi:hypothetical protein